VTFLILKIAAYLFVALLLGSAAGWVSRHVAATREIDSLSKQLNENRAKVPQLETLIRVRDDELARLRKDRVMVIPSKHWRLSRRSSKRCETKILKLRG